MDDATPAQYLITLFKWLTPVCVIGVGVGLLVRRSSAADGWFVVCLLGAFVGLQLWQVPADVIVLCLLFVIALLLIMERLRADLIAMLALAVLIVTRILSPTEALSGFSNAATVTVACMFVLSAGLQSSGVVQLLGDRMLGRGSLGTRGLLIVCALLVAPVSAFINNTAAVAVFLPVAIRACQGRGISPSRLLMPLSFFAMLGGMCTLIGTSTNILVSSIGEQRGLAPISMFELGEIGLLLLLAGLLYLVFFSPRVLPERVQPESLTEGFHLNRYLSEAMILPGSPLAGQTLLEARLGERHDLEVLGLIRGDDRTIPSEDDRLQEGDLLLVKAPAAALLQLRDRAGIAIKPGRHPDDADLRSADSVLMEAVITSNSPLEGRTLKGVDFRHRYGATALAIRRHGEEIREKIGKVALKLGDELLILVRRQSLARVRREPDFLILQEIQVPVLLPRSAVAALLIVVGVVSTAAAGLLPIAEAAVVGAVLMVTTGCLPVRRAYRDVDWRVIMLLAGVLPLGRALEVSGAADQAVTGLLWLTGDLGPHLVLGAFFALTVLLTGFVSNTATAALLAPLAITTALQLGVAPRPFLIAVTLAASAAFYTPIGYQTNLLVYGPGGYRFADFVRLGGPLNVIVLILATIFIPYFFPF